ncbi:MAG: phospho-N-acetylmuramoyl-pentapeptide-transferase [Agathobaculum sp.]|jgi:phospho-N-acetylmuramoyl-pentapeptide-transferase|uniref:phospho-N-acetylmuramoyl-pentapeptide- transferase n=1 Tax=Agathobaculum sp. TaxID=2048138 RepID=UPI003D8B63BD
MTPVNSYTALILCAVAFAVTAAIGPAVIRYLRKMKFGQKILEIGPKWHMNKQNIPTMGGFMFIIGIAVAVAAGNVISCVTDGEVSVSSLAVLGLAVAYGAVGLVDDYAKIKKKQNAGLTPKQKLVLQILVAAVFILVLFLESDGLPKLWIPFTDIAVGLPWPLYIIFAAFVIVGADNAVNLTDGIDGLAAGVTLPVAVFFTCVGIARGDFGVTIFAASLAGGLAGFLIYNFNPAKVFMGDTGSLFLGGAVAGLAFACDMPLILLLVGLIYIIETLSVILQVTYFKISGGKRLFKMAPIHHHFEMCGWGEKKIVLVFAGVTILLCLLAYFGALRPVL